MAVRGDPVQPARRRVCIDAICAYLARYGEPEAAVAPMPSGEYDKLVVIPCYDERPGCLDEVLGEVEGSLLAVVVVNAPEDAPPGPLARTRALWASLTGGSNEPLLWTRTRRGIPVLAVNRAGPERQLPRRQGVGLARKIGTDIGCALFARGAARSPWLYFTDADVRLPRDYANDPGAQPGCLVMPFRHLAPRHLAARAERYELHLRYYVDRLRYAGSPYAFHTIGSTIAIHAGVYAKVRGVPKRNAGEDFHLLNKAAKTAPVHVQPGPEILIKARLSSRTPFGTGPALRAMHDVQAFPSYAHESFGLLREAVEFINDETPVQPRTRALLDDLGFFQMFARAQAHHRRPHTLRKALHQWFDALRTLRFLHLARRYHPDRPLMPMLDSLFGKADHLAVLKAREGRAMPRFGVL